MSIPDIIKAAYEEWCRPRMGSVDPDHPADAFEAGYRRALSALRGLEQGEPDAWMEPCADPEGWPEIISAKEREEDLKPCIDGTKDRSGAAHAARFTIPLYRSPAHPVPGDPWRPMETISKDIEVLTCDKWLGMGFSEMDSDGTFRTYGVGEVDPRDYIGWMPKPLPPTPKEPG